MIDSLQQQLIFEESSFSELQQHLQAQHFSKLFIILDENSQKHCWTLLKSVFADLDPHCLVLGQGESQKSLETVQNCYEFLTQHQADRQSLLISLSGGLLSDLAGFVAATYKRGIQFAIIPTTLLSMCDAAIGGKTGVNFQAFKNHIGAFYPAKWVYINPVFLKTLSDFELLSGKGELIKYALIAKPEMLKELEEKQISLALIKDAVDIKLEICKKDFREKAERKFLNFGHTFGHAIESLLYSTRKVSHGHCVAIGMMVALECSSLLSLLPENKAEEAINFIAEQFDFIALDQQELASAMNILMQDKKNQSGKIMMVLLTDFGTAVYDVEVQAELISKAYLNLKAKYQLS